MKKSLCLRPFIQEPPARRAPAVGPGDADLPVSDDPAPKVIETATEHSMRWEDDGGPAVEVEDP